MTRQSEPLTGVSLFGGVGGIDLAAERNGIKVVAVVEIDDAARGVLADQFPGTALFTDVTEVTGDQLRAAGFVPKRGVAFAGFPCQDLSVAGRRKGMGEGTRSGLYWHIVRLVADLRPAWIVLENVPGLLSATCPCPGDGACVRAGRAVRCGGELHAVPNDGACVGGCIPVHGGVMGAVVGSLAELGYGVAYRVLDAQHFGVPQRRRRVVIVGRLGDARGPVQVLLEPEGSRRDHPSSGTTRAGTPPPTGPGTPDLGVAPALTARYGKGSDSDASDAIIVSTLQGGGSRGHRIDAESAGGGHLIVLPEGS